MIQALAITAWRADLLTKCAFTALKINVLEANAASAMGPGSILAERSSGALAVGMVLPAQHRRAEPVRRIKRLAEHDRRSRHRIISVSYTHLRAHETPEHLVCRL